MKRVRKNRYNLTLPPHLHAWAKEQSEAQGTSLSDYISGLLEEAHARQTGEIKMTRDAREQLRGEVVQQVLASLARQRRGG